MKLYDYFGSTCAYRVRIALSLKGLSPERVAVDIVAGEQFRPGYLVVNPTAAVPSLVSESAVLIQSLAIVEYLDELHPAPPLLPVAGVERARVRAIALTIACDIQPLHPGRIAKYLSGPLGAGQDQVQGWCVHWIASGMKAVEALLASDSRTGGFCHGNTPTLADIVLVPQVYAAVNRFKLDMPSICPRAWKIYRTCMELPAFRDAAPDRQIEPA